jgi:hypothetical protein
MYEEQKFWYAIWRLISVVVCVIALAIAGTYVNHRYQLRMLITESKIDPISAACAFDGAEQYAQCIIHGVRR